VGDLVKQSAVQSVDVIVKPSFKMVSNTSNEVVLEFTNNQNTGTKFNVYDITGSIVREVVSSGKTLTINKDLPPGVYFVICTTDNKLQTKITIP
jgi:hypothetical protein